MSDYGLTTGYDPLSFNTDYSSSVLGPSMDTSASLSGNSSLLDANNPDATWAYEYLNDMPSSDQQYLDSILGTNAASGDAPNFFSSILSGLGSAGSSISGTGIAGLAKSLLGGSSTNAGLLGALAGLYSYFNPDKSHVGYTGGIPNYTVVREDVPVTYDPNRRAA